MRLEFKPGIIKSRTRYGATASWFDGSLVRFRDGLPESWGGWVKAYDSAGLALDGVCRSLFRFEDLAGFPWVGIGTNKRFYVASDDVYYEVTPIASTVTLGTDPIATTISTTTLTITHTAHGQFVGKYVILSGATGPIGGIPASEINAEHEIATIVDDNTYTVEVTTTATSSASGGGTSVQADYLYRAGSDSQIYGGGWGYLGWGDEYWGGDPSTAADDRLGTWTQGNWGEDLVACGAGGPIWYWDATTPSARMVDILDLAGADGYAPTYAEFILVSQRDRHLIAFGASEYSSGNPAPMAFRWSDQEDMTNWNEADTTGTAGSLPLSIGSKFISAISAPREIIAWSDSAIYSIQYVGAPYIFVADVIEAKSDIVGLHACTTYNGVVYWMGRSGFYSYSGRVQKLPCTVWDYIYQRIDEQQLQKVYASTNRKFSEVIWFYQSMDSTEIDSYVTFNPLSGEWCIGSLARTAWMDGNSQYNPLAASTDTYLYYHEVGSDDGSTSPAQGINSYIESAPIELSSEGAFDRGDRFAFIRRILPDVTFRNFDDNINTPQMNLVLKMMDKPGGGFDTTSTSQVVRSAIVPVETFTEEAYVRLRGRSLTLRAESDSVGTQWRLGVPRIDVRTDGQR